jgi:medium-chain acyl-[acyl-carrier-protein] hydrolase
MQPLVEAAAASLLPYFDKPFAFFGHSMGALISFELARLLRKKYGVQPVHLFVSGHRAPQLEDRHEKVHDLPDDQLVQKLNRLDGTPKEALEHPELMQVLLPILRADFAICETYQYTNEPPLAAPVLAFGGMEDEEAGPDQLKPWKAQTSGSCSVQMFPGGHFFLHTAETELLGAITRRLTQLNPHNV